MKKKKLTIFFTIIVFMITINTIIVLKLSQNHDTVMSKSIDSESPKKTTMIKDSSKEKDENKTYEKTIFYQGSCYSSTDSNTLEEPDLSIGKIDLVTQNEYSEPQKEFQANFNSGVGKKLYEDEHDHEIIYVEDERIICGEVRKIYTIFKKGLKEREDHDVTGNFYGNGQAYLKYDGLIYFSRTKSKKSLSEDYEYLGDVLYEGAYFIESKEPFYWGSVSHLGYKLYRNKEKPETIYIENEDGTYQKFQSEGISEILSYEDSYARIIYLDGKYFSSAYSMTIQKPDCYIGKLLSEKREGYQPEENLQGNWIGAKGRKVYKNDTENHRLYVEYECMVYSKKEKCYEVFEEGIKKAAEMEEALAGPKENLKIVYQKETYINKDPEEQTDTLPAEYENAGTIMYIGNMYKNQEFSCIGWQEERFLGCELYAGKKNGIYIKTAEGSYLFFDSNTE